MKKMSCVKCGDILDPTTPAYSGLSPKEAVKKLASDHASKQGCDWPAANVPLVLRTMNT